MISNLPLSDYVKIIVTVPVSAAEKIRKVMGETGIGKLGNYSFCSHSTKGIGRFFPEKEATPSIGKPGRLESVEEERIETYCPVSMLPSALTTIKEAHPYEETIIDILPVYAIGRKTPEQPT